MRARRGALVALSLAASLASTPARAEPELVQRARAAFLRGAELVEKAQWAEALAAFEESSALRPHAVTTYNVGACERALGRYTRARRTLAAALEHDRNAGGAQLSASLEDEARAMIDGIDRLLARVSVRLSPAGASVAVDGRPLESVEADGRRPLLVAGIRPPGRGEPPPAANFDLLLDPGAHVFTVSRRGFADAVVNRTFAPGSRGDLALELELLPATLRIASTPAQAIVTVNGSDVGPAPVDVLRPAGSYRVVVRKEGFLAYESEVVVRPGEEVKLRAALERERVPLLRRWWFWAGAAAVVVGSAAASYALFREDPPPTREPPSCGGLGWCIEAR